jgi:hypothetical protein
MWALGQKRAMMSAMPLLSKSYANEEVLHTTNKKGRWYLFTYCITVSTFNSRKSELHWPGQQEPEKGGVEENVLSYELLPTGVHAHAVCLVSAAGPRTNISVSPGLQQPRSLQMHNYFERIIRCPTELYYSVRYSRYQSSGSARIRYRAFLGGFLDPDPSYSSEYYLTNWKKNRSLTFVYFFF